MSIDAIQEKMREFICPGCLTYSIECNTKPISDGIKCPCSICLVKMICVTPCNLLYKHKNTYIEFRS